MSDVDKYIADLDANSKTLVIALRNFIVSEFPQLTEEFKWKQPVYISAGKDVVYIAATQSGANFGFIKGAILNDPQQKLVGTGKLMRHIKIPDMDSIDTEYFKDLITQALAGGKQ